MTRRLTMALPSKGRLREPSWSLLEASGVDPQEPGERVLQAHCRNAEIDLLFVRADDVPEYVQDGVVDCGITGLDLVFERDSDVEVLLRLGTASCSLQAAVSMEDSATEIADLEGRRIATSHPRIAAQVLAERGINAELVECRRFGRDLAATRTGRRDHRPRLDRFDTAHEWTCAPWACSSNQRRYSSGERVRPTSKLARRLRRCLGSVINARANRYLLCNVAKDRLERCARGPANLGLADRHGPRDPGVVAVHALVPAADIWSLLPQAWSAAARVRSSRSPSNGWCHE